MIKHNSVLIFGICPGEVPDRDYAFIPVSATIQDNRLIPLANAKEAFPSRGYIHVTEDNWLPGRDVAGIWRVHRSPEGEGQHRDAYSGEGRGHPGALEIIDLPVSRDQPDEIRHLLSAGIRPGYSPSSPLLLKLTDGAVIGPVRCEPIVGPGPNGFTVKAETFLDPFSLWNSAAILEPFTIVTGPRTSRIFSSFLSPPRRSALLDCAQLDEAVRTVLKAANVLKSTEPRLTKKQIETLSQNLRRVGDADRVATRVERVEAALQTAAKAGLRSTELTQFLLAQESVQKELEEIRRQAQADEKTRVMAEEKEKRSLLKNLKEQCDSVSARLKELTGAVDRQEAEVAAAADKVIETMRVRLLAARDEPAELLSTVALLRPFLSASPAHVQRNTSQPQSSIRCYVPDRIDAPTAAVTIETLPSQLQSALQSVGVLEGVANRFGKEIASALLIGQMPMFCGSMATSVAVACLHAIANGHARCMRIPVGVLDGAECDHCLETAKADAASGQVVSAILIETMNLSAIEAYGASLETMVTRRLLGVDRHTSEVWLFGTLSSGPSSLPSGDGLSVLGPIFDTDLLTLVPRTVAARPVAGSITHAEWNSYVERTEVQFSEPEELERLIAGASLSGNVVWRRGAAGAYHMLMRMRDEVFTPLQSLVYGWLLHRYDTYERPSKQALQLLNGGRVDSKAVDPRIQRWLTRLDAGSDRSLG